MYGMSVRKLSRGSTWIAISNYVRTLRIAGIFSQPVFSARGNGNTGSLESGIRAAYWIIGLGAGAFLTYSTRHFINGDAINYIEMGEALRMGRWSELVNLTASPGYAFLLGVGQLVLDTNRWNEVPLLKWVNYLCMIFALGACDVLVQYAKGRLAADGCDREEPLPRPLILLLAYAMCLFSVFNWIRPRLIAPEMVIFGLVMATAAVILWIREDPRPYGKFALLGVCAGMSYLFKTFFFPFAFVFFALAAIAARSVRLAVPRMIVAVLMMLMVSAPLLYGLSEKVGHFSFGETGKLNYAKYIAGKGESLHKPIELIETPEVLLYRGDPYVNSTRPAAFDPSYWTDGIEPVFTPWIHVRLLLRHVWQILGDRPALSICCILWCLWLAYTGALNPRKGWQPSPSLILALLGCAGIVLYSIIHVEMRYVAPFLFLTFLAMVLHQRHNWDNPQRGHRAVAYATIVAVLTLGLTVSSVADQSIRGLRSTPEKPSYAEAYAHMLALKDFLLQRGVEPGTDVALVGMPPYYWGRMAGLRIIAEIPNEHQLLSASDFDRRQALEALHDVGVNLVIASGPAFAQLSNEGWTRVPGTRDYYVFMGGQPNRPRFYPQREPMVPGPEYRTFSGVTVNRRVLNH